MEKINIDIKTIGTFKMKWFTYIYIYSDIKIMCL